MFKRMGVSTKRRCFSSFRFNFEHANVLLPEILSSTNDFILSRRFTMDEIFAEFYDRRPRSDNKNCSPSFQEIIASSLLKVEEQKVITRSVLTYVPPFLLVTSNQSFPSFNCCISQFCLSHNNSFLDSFILLQIF